MRIGHITGRIHGGKSVANVLFFGGVQLYNVLTLLFQFHSVTPEDNEYDLRWLSQNKTMILS